MHSLSDAALKEDQMKFISVELTHAMKPESVMLLLNEQMQFVKQASTIAMLGLTQEALDLTIEVKDGGHKTVAETIIDLSGTIISIEPTKDPNRFLFVVLKKNIPAAQAWLDKFMPDIFKEIPLDSPVRLKDFPHPCRENCYRLSPKEQNFAAMMDNMSYKHNEGETDDHHKCSPSHRNSSGLVSPLTPPPKRHMVRDTPPRSNFTPAYPSYAQVTAPHSQESVISQELIVAAVVEKLKPEIDNINKKISELETNQNTTKTNIETTLHLILEEMKSLKIAQVTTTPQTQPPSSQPTTQMQALHEVNLHKVNVALQEHIKQNAQEVMDVPMENVDKKPPDPSIGG
jgi:hypothetical protein